MLHVRLRVRGRSKCPADEVSVNRIVRRTWVLDFTYTSIEERRSTKGLHDGREVQVPWIR
jgi:hypothetical protein